MWVRTEYNNNIYYYYYEIREIPEYAIRAHLLYIIRRSTLSEGDIYKWQRV
jgi:hypothetical protein